MIRLQWQQNVATTFAQLNRVTVNDSVFVVRLFVGLCQSLDDVSYLLQRLPLLNKFILCQLYNCIVLVVVIIFGTICLRCIIKP